MRRREIKQSVIRAGRIADIHTLEHLLDHQEISRIAAEIGSEFPVTWASEGHVVAKDIMLSSACADDGGQGLVRFVRRIVAIDFDIVYLRAADNLLLRGHRDTRPCVEIMKVFLDDHIAAT